MNQAVGLTDAPRLPWLEPYRAPVKARRLPPWPLLGLSAVAVAGVIALLLIRPQAQLPAPPPQVKAELPAASVAVAEPVARPEAEEAAPAPALASVSARPARRSVPRVPKIVATPQRDAYENVLSQQIADALLAAPVPTIEPAPAPTVAAPVPAQPLRPAVNPSARVVRGQTVQLGIYLTARQAEVAWQSAIRDYTFLVTMPKSISPVRFGARGKRYYRLQLGTPSKRHAKQLCGNLKATGRSCTVA